MRRKHDQPRTEPLRSPQSVNDAPRYSSRLLGGLSSLHDVNALCIEMLVRAARKDRLGEFSLVDELKHPLQRLTPEVLKRAAQGSVLLTDMQFANLPWWRTARDHPTRPAPLPSWRGSFPRDLAVPLARATLMLCWHSVHSHPENVPLLGVLAPVAEVIATLALTDIDRIVERRFRHLRPRWEDRPAVWRALLAAAESQDFRKTRDFNIYSLQLITGELWTSAPAAR